MKRPTARAAGRFSFGFMENGYACNEIEKSLLPLRETLNQRLY
jgi:hypothetical protein